MGELVQQGRQVLRLFLALAAILLWILLEGSPGVLARAVWVTDAAIFGSPQPASQELNSAGAESLQVNTAKDHQGANPRGASVLGPVGLDDLSADHQRSLSHYQMYAQYFQGQDADSRSIRMQAIRDTSVAAVLSLGEKAFFDPSRIHASHPLTELYQRSYRAAIADIESWLQQSGLSSRASIGDLHDALQSTITSPVIDKPLKTSLVVNLISSALLVAHMYLHGILATLDHQLRSLLRHAKDRSEFMAESAALAAWLPFHKPTLSIILAQLALLLPGTLWVWICVLSPLASSQLALISFPVLTGAALVVAGLYSAHELRRVRAGLKRSCGSWAIESLPTSEPSQPKVAA